MSEYQTIADLEADAFERGLAHGRMHGLLINQFNRKLLSTLGGQTKLVFELRAEIAALKHDIERHGEPAPDEVLREMSRVLDPVIMGGYSHHVGRLRAAYDVVRASLKAGEPDVTKLLAEINELENMMLGKRTSTLIDDGYP